MLLLLLKVTAYTTAAAMNTANTNKETAEAALNTATTTLTNATADEASKLTAKTAATNALFEQNKIQMRLELLWLTLKIK